MKQLFEFKPKFDPLNKKLDFRNIDSFDISRLYGVINVTRSTPIYLPGIAEYGITSTDDRGILYLTFDTTTHSEGDILNVYYDVPTGDFGANTPKEHGGYLQSMSETLQLLHIELILMNHLLQEGLNIRRDDAQAFREEITNQMSGDGLREI